MIHLHRAEQLDVLLDALADVLRPAPPDPFTRDLVVVPAAGISDAVQAGLARRLGDASDGFGVCANVEFVFPGRFIARALGDPTAPDLVDTDPWRLPRLAWWVLDELHAGSLPLPGARSSADGWPLARRIADLIDRYTSQRPSLIEAWAKGIPTDGTSTDGMFTPLGDAHLWQLTWWQAVRARSGQPSAPERLPALLAAVVDGRATIDLPQRLSVFGVGSLPPAMAGVLAALSQSRDVHVFLKHPSMAVWQRPGGGLSPGVHTRDQADATEGVQHPLLASWGRPALEAQALLRGNPAISDEPCATAAPATPATSPDTLLGAVQRAIRLDLAPGVVAGLDGTDGTFQVHACHGSVRQLEALRDALGHAFIADSSLKPHEVLVLCPDLDTYAPLIEAVFQRGNLPIPVKVGDRSLTTQDPLVGALHAVLQLVSGRATLTEVLALAQFEPVRRRFGWTIDQVEQLADWCVALGTRWGLSAQHRAAWGLEGVAEGTWRTMVDQLLAGVAMQAPTPRKVLGELSPFDDLSNDDMVVVGSVAELLARLDDVYEALQSPKPVSQWVEMLLTTVDMFTAVDTTESWRRQQVRRDLDAILVAATDGTRVCEVPLSLADIRSILSESLNERAGRLSLRSGSVTVSSLLPQHGVPARIICLLGLDEGTLRGGTFDGDDILGLHPCVGERHPRHDTRQLLLDALLDTSDRFIVTCTGADLTTNKPVPFVVPLVELLDVVAATADPACIHPAASTPWLMRHPRHGFNERALQPGTLWPGSATPFTFDPAMLDAAQARRGASTQQAPSTTSKWLLPEVPLNTVHLDQLVDAVGSPSRVFLRSRLQVLLPGETAMLDDGLAVAVDPLTNSALGRELLDARRLGEAPEQWADAVKLRGGLPPGELSNVAVQHVTDEIGQLEALATDWSVPLASADSLAIDLQVPRSFDHSGPVASVRLLGEVGNVHRSNHGARLVSVRYSKARPSFRLGAAIHLAAAHLSQPDIDWGAVLVHRGEHSGAQAVELRLQGTEADRSARATRLLTMAVELLAWAHRDAVPFFDRASRPLAAGQLGDADDALVTDFDYDDYATLLWPGADLDALMQLRPLPTDPAHIMAELDGTASRVERVARWVWDTYGACIDEYGIDGTLAGESDDHDAGDDE